MTPRMTMATATVIPLHTIMNTLTITGTIMGPITGTGTATITRTTMGIRTRMPT